MEPQTGHEMPTIVIPKERAVFWLDAEGRWHNVHGRFRKKKIIDRFHHSIQRDNDGYFVSQINCGRFEKVYFPYEDTALFVVRVTVGRESLTLHLNTGRALALRDQRLFTENDALYLMAGNERIRFTERAVFNIAPLMEEVGEGLGIRLNGEFIPIQAR